MQNPSFVSQDILRDDAREVVRVISDYADGGQVHVFICGMRSSSVHIPAAFTTAQTVTALAQGARQVCPGFRLRRPGCDEGETLPAGPELLMKLVSAALKDQGLSDYRIAFDNAATPVLWVAASQKNLEVADKRVTLPINYRSSVASYTAAVAWAAEAVTEHLDELRALEDAPEPITGRDHLDVWEWYNEGRKDNEEAPEPDWDELVAHPGEYCTPADEVRRAAESYLKPATMTPEAARTVLGNSFPQ